MKNVWLTLQPGTSMGTSPWFQLKQEMFSEFEELTLSYDKLHTDPKWVMGNTNFKSTIAPGFFVMSLLPHLYRQALNHPSSTDWSMYYSDDYFSMNYGFDKLRWVETVPVAARIRAGFILESVTLRHDGGVLVKTKVTVETEGGTRPSMVAEWLCVVMPKSRI
jgi:acyl dehydratase